MPELGLERTIVDETVHANSVRRFRDAKILLPTFAQLAEPFRIPEKVLMGLSAVKPREANPLNLFRVHWHNGTKGEFVRIPDYLDLPKSLTGVDARIIVLLGDRFPMITAHKVLAAYGCLAPRVITGQFDPTEHRAVWPSTGNYCRGGVAISRIMGCRGVAVLPEGMSRERFRWLEDWVADSKDIIRTPGSESNVKEIYDRCAELDQDPHNIIFNQFSEFGNYLAHYLCTGKALERVFVDISRRDSGLKARAFVAATGSAGTLGAGDYLKERYGTLIAAAEALECPTLLYNGFGEHNIQGIGDKHIPLIHNVMNTDLVTAVSDVSTDSLNILFNTDVGLDYLAKRRGIPEDLLGQLKSIGLSGICNIIASIKTAKYFSMDEADVILTIATDGADLYETELHMALSRDYPDGFDEIHAAEVFGKEMLGVATDHFLELSQRDKERIFNLGYFTWVEQQGVAIEDFRMRRKQAFWSDLWGLLDVWDSLIEEFNKETGVMDLL